MEANGFGVGVETHAWRSPHLGFLGHLITKWLLQLQILPPNSSASRKNDRQWKQGASFSSGRPPIILPFTFRWLELAAKEAGKVSIAHKGSEERDWLTPGLHFWGSACRCLKQNRGSVSKEEGAAALHIGYSGKSQWSSLKSPHLSVTER